MLLNAPLSTAGPVILGADGQKIRLCGVNWGGAHQDDLVPAGLDKLHRDVIAARIAAMGFNHVRFPFAVSTFMTNSGMLKTGPVPAQASIAANTDLVAGGVYPSPWEVYQACVASLTAAGLAVIPNQHLLWCGWCCSQADNNGLCYNDNWPASTFAACWQLVAGQFAGNDLVIGYDIHNEPRPATIGGKLLTPTWGDGNAATDMRLLYATTINSQLRPANPAKLWFCEGLNFASDLTQAHARPVGVPGTVYSLHDYSGYNHPAGQSQADYDTQMDAAGGYLQQSGQAPLWIGEFGANTDVADAALDTGWFANFLAWAQARGVHWCWWELSATAVKGTEPVTNVLKAAAGQRETYGLMSGQDWRGSQEQVLALLAPLMS